MSNQEIHKKEKENNQKSSGNSKIGSWLGAILIFIGVVFIILAYVFNNGYLVANKNKASDYMGTIIKHSVYLFARGFLLLGSISFIIGNMIVEKKSQKIQKNKYIFIAGAVINFFLWSFLVIKFPQMGVLTWLILLTLLVGTSLILFYTHYFKKRIT